MSSHHSPQEHWLRDHIAWLRAAHVNPGFRRVRDKLPFSTQSALFLPEQRRFLAIYKELGQCQVQPCSRGAFMDWLFGGDRIGTQLMVASPYGEFRLRGALIQFSVLRAAAGSRLSLSSCNMLLPKVTSGPLHCCMAPGPRRNVRPISAVRPRWSTTPKKNYSAQACLAMRYQKIASSTAAAGGNVCVRSCTCYASMACLQRQVSTNTLAKFGIQPSTFNQERMTWQLTSSL